MARLPVLLPDNRSRGGNNCYHNGISNLRAMEGGATEGRSRSWTPLGRNHGDPATMSIYSIKHDSKMTGREEGRRGEGGREAKEPRAIPSGSIQGHHSRERARRFAQGQAQGISGIGRIMSYKKISFVGELR